MTEPQTPEEALTSLQAQVQGLTAALEKLEWLPADHPTVHGRRMWTCPACSMTWREQEPYTKGTPPPHARGCWLAPMLGRPRYLTAIPDNSKIEQTL